MPSSYISIYKITLLHQRIKSAPKDSRSGAKRLWSFGNFFHILEYAAKASLLDALLIEYNGFGSVEGFAACTRHLSSANNKHTMIESVTLGKIMKL
jgi:hypothetical protein